MILFTNLTTPTAILLRSVIPDTTQLQQYPGELGQYG